VLGQNAVFNAKNVRSNPVHWQTEIRKSPVHYYEVSISDDRSWLILQGRRQALDEIEQTLAARCDMSAVLNVVRGPVALGRYVVPFVEESSKASRTSALFFSCLVRLIEFSVFRNVQFRSLHAHALRAVGICSR